MKDNSKQKLAPRPAKDIESRSNTEDEDSSAENKGNMLVVSFLLMLVFQLGNRIFGKLQTFPMYNYPLFLNMLSVVIYVPLCFMYIIPMMRYPTVITPEQRNIPQYKFAVMGGYDSVAGIMQMFAVNYISNSGLIVLVQQSAIPISMLISKITLNSTYTNAQYSGAGIVLLGILVVLLPNFVGHSTHTGDGDETSEMSTADSNAQLIWIMVLVISCVPMCLSSVYKEQALGEIEINIVFLNGWVAVYQLLLAIPLSIPSSLAINLPIVDIMPNMYGGLMCWMGINSITEDNNPNHLRIDDCSAAPVFVTSYLAFNIIYNYLIVVILKHGSANILWMASTVIVPLSNVAFSLHFMPNHQPLRFYDILGLLVIMFGLVVYRFTPQLLFVVDSLIGKKDDYNEEEAETKLKLESVSNKSVRKQVKYVGLNQLEYLNAVMDTRVMKAQKTSLTKSAMRIRGSFLMKIGIPPSPLISIRSPSTYNPSPRISGARRSPGVFSLQQQQKIPSYGSGKPMNKPHSFIESRVSQPIQQQQRGGIAGKIEGQGPGVGVDGRARAQSITNTPYIPTIDSTYVDSQLSRHNSFVARNHEAKRGEAMPLLQKSSVGEE